MKANRKVPDLWRIQPYRQSHPNAVHGLFPISRAKEKRESQQSYVQPLSWFGEGNTLIFWLRKATKNTKRSSPGSGTGKYRDQAGEILA
jgi:hypothetical protein